MSKAARHRYASVWDAIEDTAGDAAHMKARSSLMMAVIEHIEKYGLTQAQAAKLLGVTQPRISDLTRGKVDLFSLDTLVDMLAAAGLKVEMRLRKAA
ncbi:MAG: helix-turn-helix domain-containing protein [Burkholderiales bacterium]